MGTTAGSITNTGCTIAPAPTAPVAGGVVTDFNNAYSNLNTQNPTCDFVLSSTPATATLAPGVYCFTAGATMNSVIFTLSGPPTGIWVFKVGTGGTGSLTGNSFQVLMSGGGQACNVYWRTAQAATMTNSDFLGTILSGSTVTLSGGTFTGRAMATTDATLTGVGGSVAFSACALVTPTLTTQVNSAAVVVGATITDTATLSGGAAPTGTITFNLYGPNDLTCTGAVIATSTLAVAGNGNYVSGGFLTAIPGTYRWIANYSGDANNSPIVNACNGVNENVVVAAPALAITTLPTQASPGTTVTIGQPISDTATLSGGAAPTGTITFNLYGPNDLTCTGAPISTSTATVSGNGSYSSTSFTPLALGVYRWIANYGGDANNAATANFCNASNERVLVVAVPSLANIPTLSEWGMIILAGLLALLGFVAVRRRATQGPSR
ncbi:MAG: IPTL-CTERM sorting domain-containing protein [Usitatibacter sp.]